jgi:AraC-like DNA-binding protein
VLGERFIGPAVDRPVVPGPGLRDQVAALHDSLVCPDRELEAETTLAFVVERIAASFRESGSERSLAATGDQVEHMRALLDAHLFERVSIANAAAAIGAGPTQLARSFSAVFGIPPHAYVLGRRLEAARERILGGQALADVAAEVGFCDQAHFSRRFRRYMGTTPGRFQRASQSAGMRRRPLPLR